MTNLIPLKSMCDLDGFPLILAYTFITMQYHEGHLKTLA